MGRKKLKHITRKQYQELSERLRSAGEALSTTEKSYEKSKRVWSRQEDEMLGTIQTLHRKIDVLRTEKSCLMEVIIKLGEDIGEDNSEIENLRSQFSNQINTQTITPQI